MEFKPLAKGYYLEGLCVDGDSVWFTDVICDGVQRLSPDGRVDRWLTERQWIGCLILNDDGCVIVAGPGGAMWLNPKTGKTGMLVDTVEGKKLPGVNEMYPLPNGGLMFGTLDAAAIEKGVPPEPAALCRLDPDGRTARLWDGFKFSNGIGLSADGRHLYHNETFVGTFVHDVASDGRLGKPKMLLDKFDVDGLGMDVEGNLWIAGYRSSEIIVLRPDGAEVRRIKLPEGGCTNLRFGGTDGRDLYVNIVPLESGDGLAVGKLPESRSAVLYHTRTDVPGRVTGRTRFRLG